jgi:hypothetical protein
MAYEFHNHNRHAIECTIPPHGTILVPQDTFVPTPKQEAAGLTADIFETFTPSLLKITAPAVRRRLLEAEGIEVPKNIVTATAHLEEFQRVAGPGNEGATPELPEAVLPQDIADDEIVKITDAGTEVVKDPTPPESVAPPPPPPAEKPKKKHTRGGSLANSTQEMADALCSSTTAKKGKNVKNPD